MTDQGSRARFSRDLIWNVAGLAIAGVCGILLNYLVSVVYDSAALGIFNQVFALYIIVSQFAALGFHYSAMTHIAASPTQEERKAIATSALAITLVTATLFAGLFWLAAHPAGRILQSDEVAQGLRFAAPGVLFFALSKVILGCLNGLRRMRAYAVFSAGRFVLMLLTFAVCAAYEVPRAALPVVLTVAEVVTCLASLPTLAPELGRLSWSVLKDWSRTHLLFGVRGFMSGMLSELNTRVDVLMLGAYTDDTIVGAYSFAAILAEGFFQLLVVLRTNYAPILVRLWSEKRHDELHDTLRRTRNRTYLGALAVGLVAIAGYMAFVPLVTSEPALVSSWPFFAVLMVGMIASAGYAPLQPMLLYGSHPGWHTMLMLAIVLANAALNLVFIVALGPIGAAVATGLAFAVGVALLRVFAKRLMGLHF